MKPRRFITRSPSEVRARDQVLGLVPCRSDKMHLEYVLSGRRPLAHIFVVGTTMYCRGNKESRAYARGFYDAWRRAVDSED